MRDPKRYELYRVEREIQIHGNMFTVLRDVLDQRGEKTGKTEIKNVVKGLYHVSMGYVRETIADGTITKERGEPKVLVTFEDSKKVFGGDIFEINNKRYVVSDINNIQEYNIVCDISLKEVLHG